MAKTKPSAELKSTEPKKVAPVLAPGNVVSKISVPTQPRIMRKPRKQPMNAPITTTIGLFTLLIQYAKKSEIGNERIKPNKSANQIPCGSTICIVGPPIVVMPPEYAYCRIELRFHYPAEDLPGQALLLTSPASIH